MVNESYLRLSTLAPFPSVLSCRLVTSKGFSESLWLLASLPWNFCTVPCYKAPWKMVLLFLCQAWNPSWLESTGLVLMPAWYPCQQPGAAGQLVIHTYIVS